MNNAVVQITDKQILDMDLGGNGHYQIEGILG